MTDQPHVVVMRKHRWGKPAMVRVYGPYSSRKVAQRFARREERLERIAVSLGEFTATAHALIDNRPQWGLVGVTVQEVKSNDPVPLTGHLILKQPDGSTMVRSRQPGDPEPGEYHADKFWNIVPEGAMELPSAVSNDLVPGDREVPAGSRTWDAGPSIGVYDDAHWLTTVSFKRRWHATLFHMLLNRSTTHNGTKEA